MKCFHRKLQEKREQVTLGYALNSRKRKFRSVKFSQILFCQQIHCRENFLGLKIDTFNLKNSAE